MIPELSSFAARAREFIKSAAGRLTEAEGRAEHEVAFDSLSSELFTLQFTHNPAYRLFCQGRGIKTPRITGWRDIPAVPTTAFKEFELTSIPPEERTHVFHSSGTTRQRPSRHFHCPESLALYEASLLPWFRLHIERRGRLLILIPGPVEVPHSSLAYMVNAIRRDSEAPASACVGHVASDGAWKLDFASAASALQATCDSSTRIVVLATAFSLVHLLDYLVERDLRFRLPKESRVFETGGYKGRARSLPQRELYELIKDRLGVSRSGILSEYGMSELSSQAYDSATCAGESRSHRRPSIERYFHFPPWARTRVVSPETGEEVGEGESGLLRVCDLANVFSVMAVQTEDLAVRHGDGFHLIGRAALAEPRGCSLMSTCS